MNTDIAHMQHALRLAEAGLGATYPNPSVGAVIVKAGQVVGTGATARGGRPHAETIAIGQAGSDAKDATLYVTLEPCSHHGQTPPCVEAIIAAGIKKVVIACGDPNPLVAGQGIAALQATGIEVVQNICEGEALRINEGFFSLIKRKRPFVNLKIATSLDAKITDYQGSSKWITGDAARQYGHCLRSKNDAILTGIATVIADNPSMDCRIKGLENNSPQRVVLDRNLRIAKDAKILPAWIFSYDIEGEAIKELQKNGSQIFSCSESEFTLENVLLQLGQLGITRLLIEAGSRLSSAFLRENLVDRIYWFRSPMIIGKNGLNAIEGDDLPLAEINRYRLVELKQVGGDVLEVYDIKP